MTIYTAVSPYNLHMQDGADNSLNSKWYIYSIANVALVFFSFIFNVFFFSQNSFRKDIE